MNNKLNNKVVKITYIGILLALSVVGSLIIRFTTISLDSMPGYFAALFLGPVEGAIVLGLGHLITASIGGFPFTIPMHLIVAIQMALIGLIFGILSKKINKIAACVIAIILNGPILALISAPASVLLGLKLSGLALFKFLLAPLTIASGVNVAMAYVLYIIINNRLKK